MPKVKVKGEQGHTLEPFNYLKRLKQREIPLRVVGPNQSYQVERKEYGRI